MRRFILLSLVMVPLIVLGACQATSSGQSSRQSTSVALQVAVAGSGNVSSNPAGINCPGTCTASFGEGVDVTLTAAAASGAALAIWNGGGCSGDSDACSVTLNQDESVQVTFPAAGLGAINHIIIMSQENRSFDHYFGHLMDYWRQNNYPQATNGTTFDGEPAGASNIGDPPAPGLPAPTLHAYALDTMCLENPSPSWNESHVDFNREDPTSTTFLGDGFAQTAGHEGTSRNAIHDVSGARVMGYYTGDNLNYYYFMASNFATSDRWFSPVMSRTQPNRMYMLAATSAGHAYPLTASSGPLPNKIIFQLLDENHITWKDYVHPHIVPAGQTPCTTPTCLFGQSYINQFKYGEYVIKNEPRNIVPIQQFFTDVANGTLPQVAYIDPASSEGLDEHPSDSDTSPANVQVAAQYVSTLVNALMSSPSWKDSVFILTWDEAGGFYDHVSPQPAVSPDGIAPKDLQPGDICLKADGSVNPGPTCNFEYTGYRLPLIVISPFARKNYVSHTVADYTAILKFIETRFNLPSLTARDAAQMDMTEFFDFAGVPWATPPTPPVQRTDGRCYLDHLP